MADLAASDLEAAPTTRGRHRPAPEVGQDPAPVSIGEIGGTSHRRRRHAPRSRRPGSRRSLGDPVADSSQGGHLRTGRLLRGGEVPDDDVRSSTAITPDGGDYELTGDLTIKGVTKPVTLRPRVRGRRHRPVRQPQGRLQPPRRRSTARTGAWTTTRCSRPAAVLIGEKVEAHACEIEAAQRARPSHGAARAAAALSRTADPTRRSAPSSSGCRNS